MLCWAARLPRCPDAQPQSLKGLEGPWLPSTERSAPFIEPCVASCHRKPHAAAGRGQRESVPCYCPERERLVRTEERLFKPKSFAVMTHRMR